MAETKIEVSKGGPLIVRGCNRLERMSDGKRYETRQTMALCRCGGSGSKPFCDGTHAKINFGGEKEAGRVPDRREDYEGAEITIHDNRGICAHAGYCTSGLPAVWRMKSEPWIDPNGASKREIIETIRQCPSGALAWSENGVAHTAWHGEERILVVPGGPYAIQGGAEILNAALGEGASSEHMTLCRCGKSENKPFCNGRHWNVDFEDEQKDVPKGAEGA